MTVATLIDEAVGLTAAEKLALIGAVWDSLAESDDEPDAAELAEARQALMDYRANPADVLPWDEHWNGLTRQFG